MNLIVLLRSPDFLFFFSLFRTELTGLVSRSRYEFSVSSPKTQWRRGLWRGPR